MIEPARFVDALTDRNGKSLLSWLAPKRSVWALGDSSEVQSCRTAISGLIGVQATELALVQLSGSIGLLPSLVAPSTDTPASGKLVR